MEASPPIKEDVNAFVLARAARNVHGVRPYNTELRRGKQRQAFAGVQYAVLPAARREATLSSCLR